MRFAERVVHLEAEGAYAVMARAEELEAQGRHIIHLEIGQPDFQTFPEVAIAGIRAISEGRTRYNPPAGIADLREALAVHTSEKLGISISPAQVIVAPGAKPMIFFPLMALLEPGDESIPGIKCRSPQGAFYAFPNVTEIGLSSEEMATYLLEVTGVAVLPGTAFGENGEGYLRICYANSRDNISMALERIGNAISELWDFEGEARCHRY